MAIFPSLSTSGVSSSPTAFVEGDRIRHPNINDNTNFPSPSTIIEGRRGTTNGGGNENHSGNGNSIIVDYNINSNNNNYLNNGGWSTRMIYDNLGNHEPLVDIEDVEVHHQNNNLDVQQNDDDLSTLFDIAANGRRNQLLAFLRQTQTIDQDSRDHERYYGRTPIMHAVHYGNNEIALCLIEELHANLERIDQYGDPILLIALRKRNNQITRSLLLVGGIDPNTQWNKLTGETPITIVEKHLLQNPTDQQAIELLKLLIRNGTDFDIESDEDDEANQTNNIEEEEQQQKNRNKEGKEEIRGGNKTNDSSLTLSEEGQESRSLESKNHINHENTNVIQVEQQQGQEENFEDIKDSSHHKDENSKSDRIFNNNEFNKIENSNRNNEEKKIASPSKNVSSAFKLFGQVNSQTNNDAENESKEKILICPDVIKINNITRSNHNNNNNNEGTLSLTASISETKIVTERNIIEEKREIKDSGKRRSWKSPRSSLRSSLLNSIFDDSLTSDMNSVNVPILNTHLDKGEGSSNPGQDHKSLEDKISEPPPNSIPIFARQRSHNLRNSLNEPGIECTSNSTDGTAESQKRYTGYTSIKRRSQRSSLPCPSSAPLMTSGNSTSSEPLSTIIQNDIDESGQKGTLNENTEEVIEKQKALSLDKILQEFPPKVTFPSDASSLESSIDDSSSQVSLLASRDNSNRSLFNEGNSNLASDKIINSTRIEVSYIDSERILQPDRESQNETAIAGLKTGGNDLNKNHSIIQEGDSPLREKSFTKELNGLLNMWSFAPLEDNPTPTPYIQQDSTYK